MKYLFSWKAVGGYTFCVVFISVFPFTLQPQVTISFFDKIVHFFMYLLLSFLAVNTSRRKEKKYFRLYGFFYALFLGLLMEVVQFFLPYRSFELADIGCNLLGSFVGVFLIVGGSCDCTVSIK